MKKIISVLLSFIIIISATSLSIVGNAVHEGRYEYGNTIEEWHFFCNNTLRFEMFVRFKNDSDVVETVGIGLADYNSSNSIDYDSLKDIIDESIPNYDLYKEYGQQIDCLYLQGPVFDENAVCYIISQLNLSSLKTIDICGSTISDLSTVVDIMEEKCTETLEAFTCESNSIREIDDRLLTDFPNIKKNSFKVTSNDLFHVSGNSDFGIVYNDYLFSRTKFCIYVDPSVILNAYNNNYSYQISVREQYEKFVVDLQNDIVEEGFSVRFYPKNDVIDDFDGDSEIAKLRIYYSCDGSELSCFVEEYKVYCLSYGDVTGDFYVDTFDVAMATECVNTFEEPEDPAAKGAMDIVSDGYIDATDLAYITYIANFEE